MLESVLNGDRRFEYLKGRTRLSSANGGFEQRLVEATMLLVL